MHWRDEETSVLVDAWGPLYLSRNRGSLRMEDWRMVCSAVNAHHSAPGLDFNRNDAACKRRICTLKPQYKEEIAKGGPTSGERHFAHLHAFLAYPSGPPPGFAAKTPPGAFLADPSGPPPGFAAKTPPGAFLADPSGPPPGFAAKAPPGASVKKGKEVEEASGCVGGSVGTTKVPAKRRYSSLEDILDGSGGPSLAKTPATVKEEEVATVTEGVLSCGCDCELVGGPAAVVTKLAEVYERVEVERLKLKKEMLKVKEEEMEMEHKKVKTESPEEARDN